MKKYFLLFAISLSSASAFAFRDKSIYMGLGYYSQNAFYKTTSTGSAKASMMGAPSYPLHLKYDISMSSDWYFSPALYYSLMKRNSAGSTAEVSMMHLVFPFGKNMGAGTGEGLDWSIGPGYMQYDIKGKGGLKELNNGNSTATFAVPGRTVSVKTLTTTGELAYTQGSMRVGLAMIIEGLASNLKRTQSFFININYRPEGF